MLRISLLTCAVCLSIISSPLVATEMTAQRVRLAIINNNYTEVGQLVKSKLNYQLTLAELETVARETGSTPLSNAIKATKAMKFKTQGREVGSLGLSAGGFLQMALYIETKLQTEVAQGRYFLSPSKTGLSRAIEHDPNTQTTFIRLDNQPIGAGKKKQVAKAILYNINNPEVVARAEQSQKMERELAITKLLQGAPGIFDTKGFGKHRSQGSTMNTIYSKLYSGGSLQNAYDKGIKFTINEKMNMALNIVKGLESLHTRGIVHCDLGARNYLVHISPGKPGKRTVDAVIADLGRATYTDGLSNIKVQGNTTYTAPEGLYKSKMKNDDYYRSDIFATGCVLYQLFYEKKAVWQNISYVKDTSRPLSMRYQDLVGRINFATKARRNQLAKRTNSGKATKKERFEYVILKMLDPNPTKRGTASELRSDLEAIVNK